MSRSGSSLSRDISSFVHQYAREAERVAFDFPRGPKTGSPEGQGDSESAQLTPLTDRFHVESGPFSLFGLKA